MHSPITSATQLSALQFRTLRAIIELWGAHKLPAPDIDAVLSHLAERGCSVRPFPFLSAHTRMKDLIRDLLRYALLSNSRGCIRPTQAGKTIVEQALASSDRTLDHHKVWVSPEKQLMIREEPFTPSNALTADGG